MAGSLAPDWSGRLNRVRANLETLDLGALVVSARPNIEYLTGFSGSAGLLVVSVHAAHLVVDGRYAASTAEAVKAGQLAAVDIERVSKRYDLTLGDLLGRLAVGRSGFEANHVTVGTLRQWREAGERCWVETSDFVEGLRLIKDGWEIARLKQAASLLSGVARGLPSWVKRGWTEREVARAIDLAMDRAGFSRLAFQTIVASGPNSAHPHAVPGERALREGDLVVLDFGGVLEGYCVDLTRMAAVGRLETRAMSMFEAVRAAHGAAIAAVRPGVTGSAVDLAARNELNRAGLGEAFLHATGHGLGLEVHEAPRLARDDSGATELRAGMVCTIEPGAYVDGVGGVRIEDDVLVTVEGREVLTDAPSDLLVV